MLEITSDDIARLDDSDLRTLVGHLCESELRQRGLTASAVTWGGAQDAPDGGIDVRVNLDRAAAIEGFIPRAATGFQVKKNDLTGAAIVKEMKPTGVLRPSIQTLAKEQGAYVIVSSGADMTDSALQNRVTIPRQSRGL